MLKRNITYENFDGEEVTETFYFNFTKTELMEMQTSVDGGLDKLLQRIIDTEDMKGLMVEFKRLVLLSYGKRSEDGKRFIKNDQLREEFSQTAAFDVLFMELATDDKAAATFVNGIVPAGVVKEIETVSLPPAPPTS